MRGTDDHTLGLAIDVLSRTETRVAVAGVSGAGKSTLARSLSGLLDLPYEEMDALHWGPNWTSRASFLEDVRRVVAGDRWITEWQYSAARPLVIARSTALIWLDLPFRVTLRRVVARTVRRRRARELLWADNVEPGLWHALLAPEGIIVWSVRTRNKYRRSIPRLQAEHPNLPVIRLRSQADVDHLLNALSPGATPFATR